MVKHKKAQSFKISKLKNLLEKLLNLSEATRICGPSKSAAPHRQFQTSFEIKVSQLR